MSDTTIQGMDFKQLRNEVQLLRDELAITKRKYEDLLYNLDDDNFADYIKREKENMKTEINVSAEGIGILVSEVYPHGVENESAIEINAHEIASKVSETDVDNKLESYSTITQTTDKITTAVTSMEGYTDDKVGDMEQSIIEQTAESISTRVSKTANYSTATRSATPPTGNKDKLWFNTANETYYYWNDVINGWETVEGQSIYSAFIQTASGFEFTNKVKIRGDLITTGKISTENFDGSGNDYIQMQREFITFRNDELAKMALGFVKDETGTAVPGIVFGAGDGEGNSRGYITKGTDGLDIFYITTSGNVARLRLDDDGKLYLNDTEIPAFDPDNPLQDSYISRAGIWNKAVIGTQDTDGEYKVDTDNVIDGAITASKIVTDGLVMRGNITWDMTNSPVKTEYSVDGETWHSNYTIGDIYMHMSFDGGQSWSNATKIVGEDGRDGRDGYNGADGSDADVTPEKVFNALTDGGKTQGLFNANGDLYINASYIKSGTLNGELVKVNNVLWLKNNEGDDVVSIFHNETNPNNPMCLISTKEIDGIPTPILLNATGSKVYIGNTTTANNEVATIGNIQNIAGYARYG